MRQVVLADDDFDIDAEIVGMPRISMTRPTGCSPSLAEFEDFDVDDHAVEIFGGL